MNNEIQKLYDAISDITELENLFENEFQKLESQQITLNDVILDRQNEILFPGDQVILSVRIGDNEEVFMWCEVVATKAGYAVKNITGKTIHQQKDCYNYNDILIYGEGIKV